VSRLCLAAAVLACVVVGPASGRTPAPAKYGGTLVVGLSGGDPDTLDPTTLVSFSSTEVDRTICETLYDTDSESRLVPLLATALPAISRDKLTYTIPLRKRVSFNDGTPFNAQAVVTSLQRHMTLPDSFLASQLESVDSVTVSDQYTVVIHLKLPFTPLTRTLSAGSGRIMSPTALDSEDANFGANPVCVGPFMFDHRVAGDNVTVIKSPYYYNRYAVHLDKIIFKPMTDGPAAAAALKAGDIQALDSLSTTELPSVQQTSSLGVIQANGLGYQGIYINIGNKKGIGNLPYTNMGTPLASSAKLRQAFEEAIDRKALGEVVFDGLVQPACSPVSPANAVWFDASIQCTPYNPKDAKKLVAASGFPNPTVHLMTRNSTDRVRLAQFIQAEEAAVGINVVIDATDNTTTNARAASGSYETFLQAWSGGVDPDTNIYRFLDTSGRSNQSGYFNPRLDFILDNGRKAKPTEHGRRSTTWPSRSSRPTGRSSTCTPRSHSRPSVRT
jgi:peptide/nickel transport system substrate-binding protein